MRYRGQCLILADHALAQSLLHVDELLGLAFDELGHRNAGPLAYHLGDVLLVDFFLDQRPAILAAFRQTLLGFGSLLLQLAELVLEPSGAFPVSALRGLLQLQSLLIQLLLDTTDCVQLVQLLLPLGFESGRLLLERRQVLLQPLEALLRGRIFLFAQPLTLDLQLRDAPPHFVQLGRSTRCLHAQPRGRLVDQVDGFVW